MIGFADVPGNSVISGWVSGELVAESSPVNVSDNEELKSTFTRSAEIVIPEVGKPSAAPSSLQFSRLGLDVANAEMAADADGSASLKVRVAIGVSL
jgi:hypothetical protein